MHTRAHTTSYATQLSISESCYPLAVRQFVVRRVACAWTLALLTKLSNISGLKYATAPCLAGREIYAKCYQYVHLPFDTKLSTRHERCQLQSDEIPDRTLEWISAGALRLWRSVMQSFPGIQATAHAHSTISRNLFFIIDIQGTFCWHCW